MPDAVLFIDTPEGHTIKIPIDGLDLDAAVLSDSRAQMPDLKKIAKALGLSEDASEDSILAKVAERAEDQRLNAAKVAEALGITETDEDKIVAKAKELADTGEEKSLEDRAKDEGKRIVTQSDFEALKADAAEGKKAADQLHQSRFDTAFADALKAGRIDAKDSTRERFQKLYVADADSTIETLKELPAAVNTSSHGSGSGPGEVPEGQDADRAELDQEVRAYMADHDGVDYAAAIDKVLAKRSLS